MSIVYQVTDSVGTGDRVVLASGDDLLVDAGVLVGSSNANGVRGSGSGHDVQVHGIASGDVNGVRLGATDLSSLGNAVRVMEGGSVYGGSAAVSLRGGSSKVVNDGSIVGDFDGIDFLGPASPTTTSSLVNRGVVSGAENGVYASTEALVVVNQGTIETLDLDDGFAIRGSSQGDVVVNGGTLVGDVDLGAGIDRYDGRGGRVLQGVVGGGAGDDVFLAGPGDDTFDGGTGIDTLDFRGSGGLRVSLLDDSGTGAAEGDTYVFFEGIMGSRGGGDTLVGNGVANTLRGFGGDDALEGGGGDDRLGAGLGADTLTGGAGNDDFQFGTSAEGSDVIADFEAGAAGGDRILISAAGFGGGLAAGSLAPSQFRGRPDNLAQDADDRFIYRTPDTTLWFDPDGTGAAGPVQIADLGAGVALASADFILV